MDTFDTDQARIDAAAADRAAEDADAGALRLVAALRGEPPAFAELVDAYRRPVFAFLGRMGFDHGTCDDLAQDTFLRVWRHRHAYDARRGTLTAWLFTIARNVALSEWRRAGRRPTASLDEHALERLSVADDALASVERQQQRDRLHRALQRLSEADRGAIALSLVDGLSAPEAAELLGCRADAFRARLSRARRRLAVWVNEQA